MVAQPGATNMVRLKRKKKKKKQVHVQPPGQDPPYVLIQAIMAYVPAPQEPQDGLGVRASHVAVP
jgi:hypothetical protein